VSAVQVAAAFAFEDEPFYVCLGIPIFSSRPLGCQIDCSRLAALYLLSPRPGAYVRETSNSSPRNLCHPSVGPRVPQSASRSRRRCDRGARSSAPRLAVARAGRAVIREVAGTLLLSLRLGARSEEADRSWRSALCLSLQTHRVDAGALRRRCEIVRGGFRARLTRSMYSRTPGRPRSSPFERLQSKTSFAYAVTIVGSPWSFRGGAR
jgi:hypothetical protein